MPLSALDRPSGLTAVNVTDGSALLLWQPSVAAVDGYVITYRADSGGCLFMFYCLYLLLLLPLNRNNTLLIILYYIHKKYEILVD